MVSFFSIMELRYDSTTGQIMYAADGIFETKDWRVVRGRHHESDYVVPRSCGATSGLMSLSGDELPDYIHIPDRCRIGRYTVM